MAIIDAYEGTPLNITDFVAHNILTNVGVFPQRTSVSIFYADGFNELYTGTDFVYSIVNEMISPFPTSGTITDFDVYLTQGADEFTLVNVSGLALSWPAFHAAALTPGTADDQLLFVAQLQGDDDIHGDTARDVLEGYAGDDLLIGWDNDDKLIGDAGDDFLEGGWGKDALYGGTGSDIFDFDSLKDTGKKSATRDVIYDFRHRVDLVDLRDIDANTKASGNQNFHFIGTQPFHNVRGELHFTQINKPGKAHDQTIVEGDVNGDGRADFQILMIGLKTLTKGDFVL
jgi:Ca2+-binding RTX toxin-like protein